MVTQSKLLFRLCNLLILGCLIVVFGQIGFAQNKQEEQKRRFACGEPTPTTQQLEFLKTHIYPQAQQRGSGGRVESNPLTYIPVRIHIIRRTDGTGGVSESEVLKGIAATNLAYRIINMQFYVCGAINYIDNTTYYDFIDTNEAALATAAGEGTGVVNIYYANTVTSSGMAVGGYAWLPGGSERMLIKNNQCNDNKTVPHELGHYFGLRHTFNNSNNVAIAERELVTRGVGANCTTKGDFICDTPSDPYNRTDCGTINAGCTYTGTCTDANGASFSPSMDNIMSYFFNCGNTFTSGQYSVMATAWENAGSNRNYTSTGRPSATGCASPTLAANPVLSAVTTCNSSGLTISWTDIAGDIGYFIERSSDAGATFNSIGAVLTNVTTFTDATAASLTAYQYRVKPINSNTNFSNVISVTTCLIYCTPIYTQPCSVSGGTTMGINAFSTTMATVNINNSGTSCSANAYGDFTAISGTFAAGSTINYTISNNIGSGCNFQTHAIWIDFNGNGVFEGTSVGAVGSEMVSQTMAAAGCTFNGTFTIPAAASAGTYRMRVRSNGVSPAQVVTSPCATFAFGEAEDYTAVITNTSPTITLSPAALTAFSSCTGAVSANQSYTVAGSNLTNNIIITRPNANFEISLSAGSGFTNTLTLPQTSGTVNTTTIYVRQTASATTGSSGNITHTSVGGATQQDKAIPASVVNALPSITVGTIPDVTNSAVSFTIPYSAATGSPDRFSISKTPLNMPGFVNVVDGTLSGSPITVTIPVTAVGIYNFNLTVKNNTTGCVSANYFITLNVVAGPTITITPTTLTGFSTTSGTVSTAQTYNLKGTNLTNDVIVTAPTDYEVSLDGTTYGSPITALMANVQTIAGQTISVRIKSSASVGSPAGSISNVSMGATTKNVTLTGTVTAGTLPFITEWITTDGGIIIPTTGTGYNYTVSYRQILPTVGTTTTLMGQTGNCTITGLTNSNTYEVSITGLFPRIHFNYGAEATKIRSIKQWGSIAWTSMENAFAGCANLTYGATAAPILSGVTNLSNMFAGCSAFNGNISNWNTTNITNMSGIFLQATNFNQDISSWNTINVTNMSYLFQFAAAFNQNISTWTTTNVTDMAGMFYRATAFNQNISTWTTTNVTDMAGMFYQASSFNQNLSIWNTTNVTNMSLMFFQATAFNQSLANWNVTNVNAVINASASGMLNGCGMNTANYDATLISWAAQNVKTGVALGAIGRTYCAGESARNSLVSSKSWVISGDSKDVACTTISTTGAPSAVTTVYGTASSSTNFNVSGTGMTAGILVTPPSTNFEVSTDNTTFTNTVTVGIAGTIASTPVYIRLKATATVNTYSGNIVLSSAGATNVNVAMPSSSVTAKPLTITGLTGTDKVFDGTTTATLSGTAALSGVLAGDVANVTLGGTVVANFASSAVGTGIAITISGYTLSGTAAGNYTVSQPTGLTANITAATTIYVNSSTGNDANNGFSGGSAKQTLQGAFTIAGDGNMVVLNAGTYNETATLTGKSITLQGVGNPTVQTIIMNGVGKTITFSGNVNISQMVNLQAGDVLANGNLTLSSNATQQAMLIQSATTNVTGNVNVQRYLRSNTGTASLGYRFISAPTSNATLNQISELSPVVNPNFNTSATPGKVSPFPTVYSYDPTKAGDASKTFTNSPFPEFDKGWVSPSALTDAMSAGKGFTVNTSASQTVEITGTVNNGAINIPIVTGNAASLGYNLIGNPYPSPIKWSLVRALSSGVNDAIYQNMATGQYTGSWASYVAGVGTNSATDDIAVMQGFFVIANAGGNVVMNNTVRATTYTNPNSFRTEDDQNNKNANKNNGLLRLAMTNLSNKTDETVIYFNDKASINFDKEYDALKFQLNGGNLPNIYTTDNKTEKNTLFSINALPTLTDDLIVPIVVQSWTAGKQKIAMTEKLNFNRPVEVYLKDKSTNTLHDFSNGAFEFNASAGVIANRFEIVFKPQFTAAELGGDNLNLYPNPSSETLNISVGDAYKGELTLRLTDISGREVWTAKAEKTGKIYENSVNVEHLASGTYILEVSGAKRMVKKVVKN